jgi:hypothetical protein
MKKMIFLLAVLIFGEKIFAQSDELNKFIEFANISDSILVSSYKSRDVEKYEIYLKEFISEFEKLNKENRKRVTSMVANEYYNFACLYSLVNNKSKAYEYIEKSIDAGYINYAHIKSDKDFENIRDEEKFKALIEPIRRLGDYLFVLKNASKYNLNDSREIPVFAYQSADNPNLVSLKEEFKLDSIAGEGNEVSKVINLMHWIHSLIRHDGSHGNPEIRNASNMINICIKENKSLNCRGLAIVLNECYLSLGFKSRFVTCLPKDSLGIDNDCHVINMVFIKSLGKWVWIDPTFDAYVMNENGELLSIEEVRERLINGKTLILNPDANWNHKSSTLKDEYLLNYMAKNLYMLECSTVSEYNLETKENGKIVNYNKLVPVEYFKQDVDTLKTKSGNIYGFEYKTSNPIKFWAVPE